MNWFVSLALCGACLGGEHLEESILGFDLVWYFVYRKDCGWRVMILTLTYSLT
jgi:hypothetical protein